MNLQFTKKSNQLFSSTLLISKRRIIILALSLLIEFCFQNSFAQITLPSGSTYIDPLNPPPTGYQAGIVVPLGSTLVIDYMDGQPGNGPTLQFDLNAIIDVKVGGIIRIDRSVLENSVSSGDSWGGIQVNGTSNAEQYIQAPTVPIAPNSSTVVEWEGNSNSVFQGQAMVSSTVIKNALIGIESKDGGIVKITNVHSSSWNSQFINCEIGVKINPYISETCPKINACYIMHTDFFWDDNIPLSFNRSITANIQYNFIGINLVGVSGVNIGGCNFKNDLTGTICVDGRGIGVKSVDSDFSLAKSGNSFFYDSEQLGCLNNKFIPPFSQVSRGNSFEKMGRGVEIKNTGQLTFNSIRNSEFLNNFFGIWAEHGESLIVNDCSFEREISVLSSTITNSCYNVYFMMFDIITVNFGGVRIYDNEFTFDAVKFTGIASLIHISIENTDASSIPSFIKGNILSNTVGTAIDNDHMVGIEIHMLCKNLNITCNEFYTLGTDIRIESSGEISDFPTDAFGNGLAANNTHSAFAVGRTQFSNVNSSKTPVYYTLPSGVTKPAVVNGITNSHSSDEVSCILVCAELIADYILPSPCILTSIKRFSSEQLKIYPNPSNGKIYLDIVFRGADMNYPVQLLSLEGKIVKEILIKDLDGDNSINVENLKSGLYLIKVSTPNFNLYNRILLR